MRRRIRLTGRRQLQRSCVHVEIRKADKGKKIVGLSLAEADAFQGFPDSALVRLRLNENKLSETLEFGTIGAMRAAAELETPVFSAPSCQLRIVVAQGDRKGLLLASTDSWTLRTDSDSGDNGEDGILLFQPMDIAPRTWKLEVRDTELPIVYVDKSVPDSRTWVRHDPVFVSTVLPAIIEQVFEKIIASTPDEVEWMQSWLRWAEILLPGSPIPDVDDEQDAKDKWLDDLLIAFCAKHRLLERLIAQVNLGRTMS